MAIPPIKISDHFRDAYCKRVEDLRGQPIWLQNAKMAQHIRNAELATELELLLIHKTKRASGDSRDYPGVKHLIDRDHLIVFLLKDETAVTCYVAPYLDQIRQNLFPPPTSSPIEREKEEIYRIIREAKEAKCTKWMRWCVVLHELHKSGFTVLLNGEANEFEAEYTSNGLQVKRRKIASKQSWKIPNNLRAYSWYRNGRWTFADFGVREPELE